MTYTVRALHDPPHIYRSELVEALDSIGITNPANVLSVVIGPDEVIVVRAAPPSLISESEAGDGVRAVVTTTTRVSIQ